MEVGREERGRSRSRMPIRLCLDWDGRKHWKRQQPRNMSLDEPQKTERNQATTGKRGPLTRSHHHGASSEAILL